MNIAQGRVIDVFIPLEYQNGIQVDVMDSNKIGFKVETENGIEKIILEQNEENAQIMKDDKVLVIKQVISGKEFIDLELLNDEEAK